jgi:hypothetical protein
MHSPHSRCSPPLGHTVSPPPWSHTCPPPFGHTVSPPLGLIQSRARNSGVNAGAGRYFFFAGFFFSRTQIVESTLELAGIFCLFGNFLRPAFQKQTEIILFFRGGSMYLKRMEGFTCALRLPATSTYTHTRKHIHPRTHTHTQTHTSAVRFGYLLAATVPTAPLVIYKYICISSRFGISREQLAELPLDILCI